MKKHERKPIKLTLSVLTTTLTSFVSVSVNLSLTAFNLTNSVYLVNVERRLSFSSNFKNHNTILLEYYKEAAGNKFGVQQIFVEALDEFPILIIQSKHSTCTRERSEDGHSS